MANTVYPISIEQTNDAITPQSGLLLFSELFSATGLKERCRQELPKGKSNRSYAPEKIVEQILLMLIGGGNHLSDIKKLDADSVLQHIMHNSSIADDTTLGRTIRRWGQQGAAKTILSMIIGIAQQGIMLSKQNTFTFDPDATEIIAEKKTAQRTYTGNKGYMPLIGFIREIPFCINAEFRPGNTSPAAGNLEFLQQAKKNMPAGTSINHYGGDAACYQGSIIDECHKTGEEITFTITAKQDKAVQQVIEGAKQRGIWYEHTDKAGKKTGRQYTLSIHKMNTNQHCFTLLIEREERKGQQELWDNDGYWYHIVATNYSNEQETEEQQGKTISTLHRKRSGSENHNKELKSGIGMEHLPCQEEKANEIYFLLGILAYNLVLLFKLIAGKVATLKKTVKTLRWEIITLAGKLVHHAGKTILKLAGTSQDTYAFFCRMRERIYALGEQLGYV